MLSYQDTQNTLHTRLVDFTLQEYFFVMQVVLGEDIRIAYASIYDAGEFKRNVPSEDEEDYLNSNKRDAEILLDQENCKKLKEYLELEYQRDIQEKATSLSEFRFTGEDVQKLLNNLLRDRTQELSESSVRDILALIKSMYDSGALESGDGFAKHFITIPSKYNYVCSQCGKEGYAVDGIDIKCEYCGATYRWSEGEHRFFPELSHL